jgi:hypothetical protein
MYDFTDNELWTIFALYCDWEDAMSYYPENHFWG